jgi:hypothetical protein
MGRRRGGVVVLLGRPVCRRWIVAACEGYFLPVLVLVQTMTEFLQHTFFWRKSKLKMKHLIMLFILQYQKEIQIYYEGPSDVTCSLSTFNFILQIRSAHSQD